MKRLQTGFAALEGLLITVIVGIIGGTGWYVLQAKSNADNDLSDAEVTSQSVPLSAKSKNTIKTYDDCMKKGGHLVSINPEVCQAPDGKKFTSNIYEANPTYKTTTPDTSGGYFVIKEWGVRAKYNGSLKIQYAFDESDTKYRFAPFGSMELAAEGGACDVKYLPVGGITRYKSTEHVYSTTGEDSGKTAAEYAVEWTKNADFTGYLKHVGDYYFFGSGGQSKCAESKKSEDLQLQTGGAMNSILQNLELIK
jgi:hypothetical protein